MHNGHYSKFWTQFVIIVILLLGFGLRIYFMRELHPNTDEYVSILASQSVQSSGLPILPSGLFYTHGLLFSIINGLFVGTLRAINGGEIPLELQFSYRIPSLFFSVLAISLLYRIGREWFSPVAGLIAAGFLVIAPELLLWGSLVRMYSLAILLIPFLVYASYKALTSKKSNKWSIIALIALAAAFMNHFLTILLVPPLVVAMVIIGWQKNSSKGILNSFNFRPLILWGTGIIVIVVASALLQSRSLPPTSANITSTGATDSDLSVQTIGTLINRQLVIFSDWQSAYNLLMNVVLDNGLNLIVFSIVILGGIGFLWLWIFQRKNNIINLETQQIFLFLFIVSVGPLIELAFFVTSYRKDPRYFVPFWPLIFLLVGGIIGTSVIRLLNLTGNKSKSRNQWMLPIASLLIIFTALWIVTPKISKILYFNPAAYDKAFGIVKDQWQPGDVVITPYSAAGGVYLGQVDYFAADIGAKAALISQSDGSSVDRYMGAPWIKSGFELQALLEEHPRIWFVISEVVYQNYYHGDWHFVEQQNLELVWTEDSAMIYRSGKPGVSILEEPEQVINKPLINGITLKGYTSQITPTTYRLFLFWEIATPLQENLTQFVHIRGDKSNNNIAQADFQPLQGEYPTSSWKVGETIVDVVDIPIPENLVPDEYKILAGLYRWDTLERIPVIDDTSGENAIELETIKIR